MFDFRVALQETPHVIIRYKVKPRLSLGLESNLNQLEAARENVAKKNVKNGIVAQAITCENTLLLIRIIPERTLIE